MSQNPSTTAATPTTGMVSANGLALCYDVRGPAAGPPVVLIMGLGTQMLGWPEPFCDALAGHGLRVIRFDNRDVGLSSKVNGGGRRDDIRVAFAKAMLGAGINAPYRLDDMAADTLGLFDGLGLGRVHVVGASMGGMTAQILAGRHPERVASLTSIMSTSGARGLPGGSPKVLMRLNSRPKSRRREDVVAHLVSTMRMIGSPRMQYSREQWTELVSASVNRCHYPAGVSRQLLAILASGNRVKLLQGMRVPSLVIHGDADPLLPVANGRHTALCIPDARLKVMPGMGHDLPPPLHEKLAGMIAAHAQS